MKSFFKRLLRRVDLELRNFSIEKSENARFFTLIKKVMWENKGEK